MQISMVNLKKMRPVNEVVCSVFLEANFHFLLQEIIGM